MTYQVDQKIKSHDFPGLNRSHCFIEGTIVSVNHETGWLEVKVEFDSLGNEKFSRIGQTVFIPIESELDRLWEFERLQLL